MQRHSTLLSISIDVIVLMCIYVSINKLKFPKLNKNIKLILTVGHTRRVDALVDRSS